MILIKSVKKVLKTLFLVREKKIKKKKVFYKYFPKKNYNNILTNMK